MMEKNISGGYSGGFTLENISFSVDKGKMYALLGLNGSGKTTIIKMITGLLKTRSGSVLVGDRNILALNERERARIISYVLQHSYIAYDMTAMDVVLMGVSPYLKAFQSPGKNHIEEAYRVFELLGMEHIANENYQILSGGLKQMVIIARAMLQNGEYMILDEPDSSLDLVNRRNFMEKLRDITIRFNKGSLISMHNPVYALNYCDNIILLKDGAVIDIDLKSEDIKSVEEKLSIAYGRLKIIEYRNKYILYYE